jgi:hypothetical protein
LGFAKPNGFIGVNDSEMLYIGTTHTVFTSPSPQAFDIKTFVNSVLETLARILNIHIFAFVVN